jgi:succinyl-diaminopimelate desuccinylase
MADCISIDGDALVDLARGLVRIPSVNPPGDYGAISNLLRRAMEAAGLETAILEGQPGRPNVFGLLRTADAGARTILLSGHMDVVGPGDLSSWRFDPFSATLADGYLWGRGAVDMKGAIAAELAAVSAVRSMAGRVPVNVMLGATVDDETAGEMGQKYVLEEGLASVGWPRPGLHILGEANSLNITGAFKGRIWLRVALRGRTAHGGAPQEGVNAIDKLVEYVRRLQARPPAHHALVGADTLNLGTLRGGTRVNAVADECEAELDLRFGTVPAAEAEQSLREVMERLHEEDPSFTVREFHVFERRDPVSVVPAGRELRAVAGAIARVTRREPDFLGTLSAGDAYHSLRHGIPAVWVGPGDARLLHAPNERIGVDELILAAKVYASIILAWAGAG